MPPSNQRNSSFLAPFPLRSLSTPPSRPALSPRVPTATLTPPSPTISPLLIDPFHHPPSPATSALPVVIIPGYGADAAAYRPMAAALRRARPSTHVSVAPVHTHNWLPTFGGRPVTPVLRLIHLAVLRAKRATGAPSVTLVAHSAAGWIARIYLGDLPYPRVGGVVWNGARHVGALFCMGTPHRSGEWVAKENMRFVNEMYPGCFCDAVRYVCLGGDGGSVADGPWWQGEWLPRLSYSMTDGESKGKACAGDGALMAFCIELLRSFPGTFC